MSHAGSILVPAFKSIRRHAHRPDLSRADRVLEHALLAGAPVLFGGVLVVLSGSRSYLLIAGLLIGGAGLAGISLRRPAELSGASGDEG